MLPASPLSSNSSNSSCCHTGPKSSVLTQNHFFQHFWTCVFQHKCNSSGLKALAESCLAAIVVHVKCDTLLVHYLYADVFDIQPYFQPHFHIASIPLTVGKCWGSQIEQEMEFKCPLYIIIEHIQVCILPRSSALVCSFSHADSAKQNKNPSSEAKNKFCGIK